MKAASTSEISVNFYQTTRRSIAENSRIYTRRLESLKSHNVVVVGNDSYAPGHWHDNSVVTTAHFFKKSGFTCFC
jgi:hypothetical protein